MATYDPAPPEVVSLVLKARDLWHFELKEHGVTLNVVFAFAKRNETTGEPDGPAIRHHGYPALALMRVNNHRDRIEGKCDATLILDGDQYPDWDLKRKMALFDHELRHLELITKEDEHGNPVVQLDNGLRPRLRCRPHDFEVGAFVDVISRHREHAVEAQAIHEAQQYVQGMFAFAAAEAV